MAGETINNGNNGNDGNSLYDSWNNAFSGEQNKITVKEWGDDRLFRRDVLPQGGGDIIYEPNSNSGLDIKGTAIAWDRIAAAFSGRYNGDVFTYDTLIQDMENRLSLGEYLPSEQVDSEEDNLLELIESRAEYESKRIESEQPNYVVIDRDDLEKSLIERYEDTLKAVVAESTNDVRADGSRPSIGTACDHLIAKKVRAMTIKAKAGPVSKQDQENFSLDLHDIGTIRFLSDYMEKTGYSSLNSEN